ncbi:MAG: tetratricopeptide repeat protein [Acidobacteriota bacterium]|jgi:tetratricopeptide (TPR) repeat protein
MRCTGCGEENPEGAKRCARCDRPLTVPVAGELPSLLGGSASGGEAEDDDGEQPTLAATSVPDHLRSRTKAEYDALKPGQKIGQRYEIVAVLGMGGMGVVYHARDLSLQRDVALKVIRPEMATSPEIMERFRREILLASKVTHRNILRIHDLGESDGLSYISMNFVDGETLRDVMQREGPMGVERAMPIALQLCEALVAAHEAGVVHRDLKPQNVLVDASGTVYIADFGLSRSLDTGETMTKTGMILGTIDYMCPEQARGETPDHRGDIYSLGIILYEMLSGDLPFRSDTALGSMMKRVHEDVPRLAKKKIPTWMGAIVARALRRDPDDRYPDVREMLADLKRQRASMAWRRYRRPRFLLRAAAVLVAVGLAVFGAVTGVRYLLGRQSLAPVAVRASLAVLPFHNATGDPALDWIRTGLPDLLRTDLQQARALRLAGEDRLQLALDGLRLGQGGEFRDDELRRASAVLGVDSILTGSLLRAGSRFRLEATVRHVVGDTVTAGNTVRVEGTGEDAIFEMADQLALKVRDELGVDADWRSGSADLSTRSPEALKDYGEGIALVRAGDPVTAASRLEAAVRADPDFALAGAVLAETYDSLGYSEKAAAAAAAASRGLGKATPYEAARVRAIQARVSNDLEAAVAAYRGLTDLLPNSVSAHFDLAAAMEDAGDLDGAATEYRRVLELDPKHPNAQFALGRVLVKQGNPSEALGRFNTALGLHMELGNDQGRATVLNGLGIASNVLGRYDDALRYWGEALEIHEKVGNRRGAGSARNNIAVVLMNLGRNEEALDQELEAIRIGEEIGDRPRLGEWYSNLGDIYQELGRPDDALRSYQESLRLVRESGDESALPWTLSNIGFINSALGKYLEAFFFQKEALARSRESGDSADLLQALIGIGNTEQVQGRYEESLKYALEGLSLARQMDYPEGTVVFLLSTAEAQEGQGDYGAALASLEEAEPAARDLGDADLLARTLTHLGSVRLRLGDLPGARVALDKGATVAAERDKQELIALVAVHRGRLLRAEGSGSEAVATLRDAVHAAEASRNHRLGVMARLELAAARGVAEDVTAAVEQADDTGLMPLAAEGYLDLAALKLRSGDAAAAAQAAARCLQLAGTLEAQDLLLRANALAARAERSRGDEGSALAHLEAGLSPLETILAGLDSRWRATFLARPATAAYVQDATRAFRDGDRPEASARLAAATGD